MTKPTPQDTLNILLDNIKETIKIAENFANQNKLSFQIPTPYNDDTNIQFITNEKDFDIMFGYDFEEAKQYYTYCDQDLKDLIDGKSTNGVWVNSYALN